MAACISPALRGGCGRGIPDPIQKLLAINTSWKGINQFSPDRAPRPGVVGQHKMNSIGFVYLCVLGGGAFLFLLFCFDKVFVCLFLYFVLLACCFDFHFFLFFVGFFLKEREKNIKWGGESLGEGRRRENRIKIYCIKNSLK